MDTSAESESPNVLVIIADDLGYGDVGYQGNLFHETPNLDRLAGRSYAFDNAYCAAPICSPSRAAMLTGNYPMRYHLRAASSHGAPSDGGPAPERSQPWCPLSLPEAANHLPLEAQTLAEYFKERGYFTGLVGKWHLGEEGFLPSDQGFDVVKDLVMLGGVSSYFPPYGSVGGGVDSIADQQPGEYLEHRLARDATVFLKEAPEPFLLVYATPLPHVPLEAPEETVKAFQAKAQLLGIDRDPVYAAMIHEFDRSVGKLLDTLLESGRLENTIVVFTSDNGGVAYYVDDEGSRRLSYNGQLRGAKGMVYEGGLRVPLLISLPGQDRRVDCEALAEGTDLLPTLMDLAGAEPPADIDGNSLLPVIRESEVEDADGDVVYTYWPNYLTSWVWFPAREAGTWAQRPAVAMREGDYKMIYELGAGKAELYDLSTDPTEAHDLAQARPEVAVRMRTQAQQWLDASGMDQPVKNAAYNPRWGMSTWQVFGYTHWISRDCTFKVIGGVMVLDCQGPSAVLRCLIPSVNRPGPYKISLRARSQNPLRVAWLFSYPGGKESVRVPVPEPLVPEWKDYTVELSDPAPFITMDLNMPGALGLVEIDSIRIETTEGQVIRDWKY